MTVDQAVLNRNVLDVLKTELACLLAEPRENVRSPMVVNTAFSD